MNNTAQDSFWKSLTLCIGLVTIYALVHGPLGADTGHLAATRQEVGNTFQTRVVTLSATQATSIASASNSRPDETCFNNSATWIYVSSATSGTDSSRMGFIVLASATFRLGAMSGAVSAMLNSGVGEVRCADGLTL